MLSVFSLRRRIIAEHVSGPFRRRAAVRALTSSFPLFFASPHLTPSPSSATATGDIKAARKMEFGAADSALSKGAASTADSASDTAGSSPPQSSRLNLRGVRIRSVEISRHVLLP